MTNYVQCSRTDPHLSHEYLVRHDAFKDPVYFSCAGINKYSDDDATPLERVLDELAPYKGKRLSLRVFVDGVYERGGVYPKGSRPMLYARVKTSDLVSFLKHECSGVHQS